MRPVNEVIESVRVIPPVKVSIVLLVVTLALLLAATVFKRTPAFRKSAVPPYMVRPCGVTPSMAVLSE